MLSIESNSQTVGDDTVSASSSHSSSMSASVTHSMHSDMSQEADKETSFLTVYSDSDAVVQADEVDPIAEADVYIAYGRDEQAEEVLLDGIAGHPDRIDIKHKLLGLYHKNENTEGFERVAEELYSQRASLTPELWQEVCTMGKEVAPNNPLFDLSSDDLVAAVEVEGASELSDDALADDSVSAAEESTAEDVLEFATVDADAEPASVNEVSLSDDDSIMAIEDSISIDISNEDEASIQLINLDDDASEISELDDVDVGALDVDELNVGSVDGDAVEIDLDNELDFDNADLDKDLTLDDGPGSDQERTISEVAEVSDLEIDPDYDEARTQFELAKVFVDLGDEDGARKILTDIVANDDNANDVLTDAQALLESINS